MANNTPIPDDYSNGIGDEADAWLQEIADKLAQPQSVPEQEIAGERRHQRIHPVAEEFVSRYDAVPVDAGMDLDAVQFLHCISQCVALRSLDQGEIISLPIKVFALLAQATIAGWRAHEALVTGTLEFPAE